MPQSDYLRRLQETIRVCHGCESRHGPMETGFSGLCPFHIERTPSFMVNSQGQMFYCFGCGAGGSVFEFVMKYEQIDFIAAARKLAERAGIQFPGDEPPCS